MNASPLPFNDLSPGEDEEPIRSAIDRVLRRGWFVLGPELQAFEAEFAAAAGARHAVGVGNGTDAIALLLRASGIAPGDEVIVPAMTAAFTALGVMAAGAMPVIVDVDPATLTLDVSACEASITPRVKALLPVHLYGQAADMHGLRRLAERHHLLLVEDCCQAHLATCRGQAVGTFGTGGAFSFYPTKNLAALGDAGAVITNDDAIAARVRRLRDGGQSVRYAHDEFGVNSRLDELQAAILRTRLERLSAWTERRRRLAAAYRQRLDGVIALIPEREPGHVYHLFPVRSPRRDQLQEYLRHVGVGTLIHYPKALSRQRAFEDCRRDACAHAEMAATELLSLPLHPRLTDNDIERVAEAIRAFHL